MPQSALSRVASYDWFASLALNPLGLAVMGPLATVIGTRAALLLAAAWLGTSTLALATLPAIRCIRDDGPLADRPSVATV